MWDVGFYDRTLRGHKKSNQKQIKGEKREESFAIGTISAKSMCGEELEWGKRKKRKMNFENLVILV